MIDYTDRSRFTEDRFTPANDFCRHPEYYHSPDSEATELEVSEFIGALVRLVQPELVVETGTYHGNTAQEICEELVWNNHGRLVTIEKDDAAFGIAAIFLNYYNSLDIVELIHGNSLDYIPTENIDLAFFDSWQEGRHLEFMHFYTLGVLRAGATVVFHDTAPHHQVHTYVEQLEADGYIKTLTFHTPRGITIGQVL